jgi:hypothetical protein
MMRSRAYANVRLPRARRHTVRGTAIAAVVSLAAALVVQVVAEGVAAADPTPPFTQCPAVGSDTSCGLLIEITSGAR